MPWVRGEEGSFPIIEVKGKEVLLVSKVWTGGIYESSTSVKHDTLTFKKKIKLRPNKLFPNYNKRDA